MAASHPIRAETRPENGNPESQKSPKGCFLLPRGWSREEDRRFLMWTSSSHHIISFIASALPTSRQTQRNIYHEGLEKLRFDFWIDIKLRETRSNNHRP